MSSIEAINEILDWAAKKAAAYEQKYWELGQASALKTKERYSDIVDICQMALRCASDEDTIRRRQRNNQYAVMASFDDYMKVSPGKVFTEAEVKVWMHKMMV